MELRNLSKNTQRYYLSAVIGVARYYQQSPDTLTQEMIEDYLLYLKNDKGNTPGTCATVVAGLRFFYNHVADRQTPFDYRVRRKTTKLPTVAHPRGNLGAHQCTEKSQTPTDFDGHLFSRT